MSGRSIRIYLIDGDASGLLTAEVMNWSGKLLVSPRTKLAELAKREESTRTGVYVLAGPDPQNSTEKSFMLERATTSSSNDTQLMTRMRKRSSGRDASL